MQLEGVELSFITTFLEILPLITYTENGMELIMKAYGEMELERHVFMTMVPDRSEQ